MDLIEIPATELLYWRRIQLDKGGRAVDLDWLLDLAGGVDWSTLQQSYLDSDRLLLIKQSLNGLSALWDQHLEDQTPLQYLVGRCPWREFELEVSEAAMIPRQETEILVDLACSLVKDKSEGRWVDLGTGSGALAVSLARAFPNWIGHAVDCSPGALSLARKNLKRLVPSNSKYSLHLGHWWEPISEWRGSFDLVVTNPPYIPECLIDELKPVVKDHEPLLALSGGADGLTACREIISGAINALALNGWLVVEHHFDQSDEVMALMKKVGLISLRAEADLEGTKRFALGRHP